MCLRLNWCFKFQPFVFYQLSLCVMKGHVSNDNFNDGNTYLDLIKARINCPTLCECGCNQDFCSFVFCVIHVLASEFLFYFVILFFFVLFYFFFSFNFYFVFICECMRVLSLFDFLHYDAFVEKKRRYVKI